MPRRMSARQPRHAALLPAFLPVGAALLAAAPVAEAHICHAGVDGQGESGYICPGVAVGCIQVQRGPVLP